MSPDEPDRVLRIFSEALERPEEERPSFLDSACGEDPALRREVESLLAAEGGAGSFLGGVQLASSLQDALSDAQDPLVGTRFGGYRVLDVIARGGMGVVYRAEQENPRREVALKVIGWGFPTPELVRRFEIEAQILGRLQHPGIARIIEAGVDDAGSGPQPFFAMERIDGPPLTRYAAEKNLGLRERLELIAAVCDAVHHAHQKAVIHRDLKPANILVDPSGTPKVLDFGVARSTDPELRATTMLTGHGALVGTLAYMSPEQVRGDPAEIDTRADVYGIGVVCFELLTGELPHEVHDASMTEAIRRIAEEPPRRLRRPGAPFPADLETILAKALDPDRERRYPSAAGLAADLRRYLADEPIAARPPSALYQIRKLISRNRLAASLVTVLLLALAGFGIVMGVQSSRVRAERDRAEREAEVANRVSGFLGDVFRIPDPDEARGNSVTAREILDRGSERIRDELEDVPDIQGRLMLVMGDAYGGLGLYPESEDLMEQVLEVESRNPDGDAETRVQALNRLAWIHRGRGEYDRGLERIGEAVPLARSELGPDSELLGRCLTTTAALLRDKGDYEGAEARFREALATFESKEDAQDGGAIGVVLYQQGWLEVLRGDPSAALELYDRACPLIAGAEGSDAPMNAWCMSDRSVALSRLGRHEDAAESIRGALAVWERILPPDHPTLATALDNLGSLHWRVRNLEEAERSYREALAMRRRSLGTEHVEVAASLYNLGLAHRDMRRYDEAVEELLEAMRIYEKTIGVDTERTHRVMSTLATIYEGLWRFPEALALHEAEAESTVRVSGPDSLAYGAALRRQGNCLLLMGRWDAVEPLLERALAIGEAELGPTHPSLAGSLLSVGRLRALQGRLDEAEELYRRTGENLEAAARADSAPMASLLHYRARLARRRGDEAVARDLLRRSASVWESTGVEGRHTFARALEAAADGDVAAALAILERALDLGYPPQLIDPEVDFPGLQGDPGLRALLGRP